MEHASIYAAGLFDGEGSVNLPSNGKRFRKIRVTVTNTCPELTSFLRNEFGGNVYVVKAREGRKAQTEWVMTGASAIEFLRKILPYMRETKKIARARIAVERIAPLIQKTGVNLSADQAMARELAERDFDAV